MKASIIVIGDEILLGQVADTNSGFLARQLVPMGWQVESIATVPDSAQDIARAIEVALWSDSQLIITTGGLGPTKDDITKGVLLRMFGGELVHNAEVETNVRRVFEKRGLQINDLTLGQAMVPSSCRVVQNRYGTAPVMWFERDGKVLIAMPGVPFETEGMMRDVVCNLIHSWFAPDETLLHCTFMVTDITESDLATRLSDFEESLPPSLHLAYLPTPGLIRLRLDGRFARDGEMKACGTAAESEIPEFEAASAALVSLLGDNLLHIGDATPAQMLLEQLRMKGLTVSSAESCTGGAIASAITHVAGSSESYMGSVVSYSNDVKQRVLGVDADVLDANGVVSEPVVRRMAEGVCVVTHTDCSMATSGIAGPGGGTPDKPVGTVWIAVHTPRGTDAVCHRFPGNRDRVIERATTTAMLMLVKKLKNR